MIRNSALWLLFLSVAFTACSKVTRLEDGVTVKINPRKNENVRTVRLQVIDQDIIRVSATPSDTFRQDSSLVVVFENRENPKFEITEDGSLVKLYTTKIVATVSKKTGEVTFADRSGKPILQEKTGGGKYFAPISVEGDDAFSFRQVFDSPDHEAFYGLGQHQADEFNYKGKNETLFQYNTKVSVPFILSTNGYGLLWDNYSLTRFGDEREYGQMDQFVLYGTDGSEGGLTASYRMQGDSLPSIVRQERTIDYESLDRLSAFPENFKFNGSRVVWEGEIEPKESGLYRFILYYAGYTTVYLDDELVVGERWRTAWNPNSYKFAVELTEGKKHKIRLDWQPDGGESFVSLKALSPVPDEEQNRLAIWSEMGDMIDYYFIHGADMDEVISGYRKLTGKAQIMPKWAMGYWQSRERYKTEDELLGAVAEYRKRGIGLDNIVLDWSYWPQDAWGSHEFDPERFPDPEGMVDSVHRMGARIMISVWPKFYHNTEHFKEFDRNGWMYRKAVDDSIRDWIGKGYVGSFYDAYSAGARKLFWHQMEEHLYSKGIDAWWMDASEPDIHSNRNLEDRKALSTPTALGSSTRYLNAYALMNAEAIYNGQRAVAPDKRVFLLTRSGFSGLQRYSTATWSGDIGTRWEDMKAQISAGLNFAMSGIPYWTMDIGGFCVEKRYEKAKDGSEDLDEWRELNARWHQFGAFCPIYRSHGQYPYREIYHIASEGHPAYESMVWYNKLRYRMMPYIYTLASKTWFDDYTIMRALVMDYTDDPTVRDIGDQFLFGPAFMAAPVYTYKARSRQVYLPAGNGWYDFYTGAYLTGGRTIEADAPYGRMPLFVKEGSIVPFGPEIVSTADTTDHTLTVFIYAGKDSSFDLYEDDGVSYGYERGAYSVIPFRYNEKEGTLSIGERAGYYPGMPSGRPIRVVAVFPNYRIYRGLDTTPTRTVEYDGSPLQLRLK